VTSDYTFRPAEKLRTKNQEASEKLQKLLTLEKPELKDKLISLIEAQIYSRIKNSNF
jgi:flagellar basal body-associated protein FliL